MNRGYDTQRGRNRIQNWHEHRGNYNNNQHWNSSYSRPYPHHSDYNQQQYSRNNEIPLPPHRSQHTYPRGNYQFAPGMGRQYSRWHSSGRDSNDSIRSDNRICSQERIMSNTSDITGRDHNHSIRDDNRICTQERIMSNTSEITGRDNNDSIRSDNIICTQERIMSNTSDITGRDSNDSIRSDNRICTQERIMSNTSDITVPIVLSTDEEDEVEKAVSSEGSGDETWLPPAPPARKVGRPRIKNKISETTKKHAGPRVRMEPGTSPDGSSDSLISALTEKKRAPKRSKVQRQKLTSSPQMIESNNNSGASTSKKRPLEDDHEKKQPAKRAKTGKKTSLAITKDVTLWTFEEVLAEQFNVEYRIAANLTKLLEENTIPFIARYRKEMTNNMDPTQLREVLETYEGLKAVYNRIDNVIKSIEKTGKMTPYLLTALRNARTMEEVDDLYAPFKTNKKTLAEQARQLGLDVPATELLNKRDSQVHLSAYIKPIVKGLKTVEEIENGVVHIMADVVAKDKDILDFTRKLATDYRISMKVTRAKASSKAEPIDPKVIDKFHLYHQFDHRANDLKPHQVLAINRGESLKVLSTKIEVPDFLKDKLQNYAGVKWTVLHSSETKRDNLLQKAFTDAYTRLLEPFLRRLIRAELTKKAEVEALRVFSSNLRDLLLTRPVRKKVILGIDPGFTHGCKTAVISPAGHVLEAVTLYPHNKQQQQQHHAASELRRLVQQHKVEIIAIGSHTACRETESFVSDMMQRGDFKPQEPVYSVVDESGTSIYSASKQAEVDLPDLTINLRSAVSIARRLQDPLTEYVKVEPKHIGVGMYQHDMPEKKLQSTLESVMVESVSFVGVDLNTCPEFVLRKVAGLTLPRVKNIITWRTTKGRFTNRQQLLDVKGIGPETFRQCAGFVRITPSDMRVQQKPVASKSKKEPRDSSYHPLDMTCIHPESYSVAIRFIKNIGGILEDVGKPTLITKVNQAVRNTAVDKLAEEYGIGPQTMKLITDGLQQDMDYDYRSEFASPVFRKGLTSIENLEVNTTLSGCVRNVTSFGAFVDIGIGNAGLLHNSKIPRYMVPGGVLNVGSKVEVTVISIDRQNEKVGLKLEKML